MELSEWEKQLGWQSNWKEKIAELVELLHPETPAQGCSLEQIAAVEAKLGVNLPEILREFYLYVGEDSLMRHHNCNLFPLEKLNIRLGQLMISSDTAVVVDPFYEGAFSDTREKFSIGTLLLYDDGKKQYEKYEDKLNFIFNELGVCLYSDIENSAYWQMKNKIKMKLPDSMIYQQTERGRSYWEEGYMAILSKIFTNAAENNTRRINKELGYLGCEGMKLGEIILSGNDLTILEGVAKELGAEIDYWYVDGKEVPKQPKAGKEAKKKTFGDWMKQLVKILYDKQRDPRGQGYPMDAILKKAAELGVVFPYELKCVYEYFGKDKAFMSNQDRFFALEQIDIYEGTLRFQTENQGVTSYGYRLEDLKGKKELPRLYDVVGKDYLHLPPKEGLLYLVWTQAIYRMHRQNEPDEKISKEDFEKLEEKLERLYEDTTLNPQLYYHPKRKLLALAWDNSFDYTLFIGAMTDKEYKKVMRWQ